MAGLSEHLGYSSRHLNRLLSDELGAGPLALARAQRAQYGADPDRDDRPVDDRRRVRRRVRQRPPVQRHDPRGVRHSPERAQAAEVEPGPNDHRFGCRLGSPCRAWAVCRPPTVRAPRRPGRPRRRAVGRRGVSAGTRPTEWPRHRRRPPGRRPCPGNVPPDRLARPRARQLGGCVVCSTSMPTRSRSTSSSAPTRSSARSWRPRRAFEQRAPSTRTKRWCGRS